MSNNTLVRTAPQHAQAPQRTYCEEVITPELAVEYLKLNTHNRPAKESRIASYANEMRRGQWRPNGEAIKFSSDGTLLDGQNRLMAVLRAGVAVQMLVVRGLDYKAQEVMDIGAQRSLADVLALRNEKNVSALASTIRALYIWDHTEDTDRRQVGSSGQNGKAALAATISSYLDYFDDNSDVCRYICNKADSIRKQTKIPTSILAPLIRGMEQIDQDDAEDFFQRIVDMTPSPMNFGESDPLTQLYKSMRRMMDNSKSRYLPTELAALIVKAWNGYRDGVPITQLRWRSGGSAPEAFPVMK